MAVIQFNTHDRLPSLDVPTLILTGTADRIVPADNSRLLAQEIRGSELIEFEGAGHGFLAECAAATNEAVLAFIGRNRAAKAA
jgi:pimeloyl-ACP methyl ester carboxylesterase